MHSGYLTQVGQTSPMGASLFFRPGTRDELPPQPYSLALGERNPAIT